MRMLALTILLCGPMVISSQADAGRQRPNIILIIADDMAWDG